MTVWPSMASRGMGRLIGRLCGVRWGLGPLTLGRLLAGLCIPLALGGYLAMRIPPWVIRRYTLTNRRVVVRKGLRARDERWVELDRFDAIEVLVRPGQQWYPAGDLIFRSGPVETFRLEGVLRPETFRQTCLKARAGYVGVRRALGR